MTSSLISNSNLLLNTPSVSISVQTGENSNSGGFVLDSSVIGFTQDSSYSTWDLVWNNWPSPSSGRWWYYDPDSTTDNTPGAWKTFTPTSISQSWIIMKAVKFVPIASGSGTSGPYITNAVYGNYTAAMNITINVLSSYTQTAKTLPYSEAGVGTCDKASLNLTYSGGKALTYPWDNYSASSPIRPLCQLKTLGDTSSFTSIGDLRVKASVVGQNISASAWFSIGDASLPKGFRPVKFTGYSSMSGDVVNPVSFVSADTFTLQTPQINLDYVSGITDRSQVGALVYNRTSGSSYYLPADRWVDDAATPLRMQLTVPKTALMIFGILDYRVNSVLPAYLAQNMQYLTKWGAKTFTFFSRDASANDNIQLTMTGSEDLYFSVSTAWQYVLVDSKTKILGVYSVGFTKSPSIRLSYPNNSDTNGYVWGVYQSGQATATGSAWVVLNTTTTNSTISATISEPGFYGIISSPLTSGVASVQFGWLGWALSIISLYMVL